MIPRTSASINYAIQEITIYFAIPIFFIGVIGTMLNILVFLTSRISRQNPCIFYLIVMSILDFGKLGISTFSNILLFGFDIDL